VWDKKIIEITGGLIVLTPAKCAWVSPKGDLFCERMIPVRIACTRQQIAQIIRMTLNYYEQKAVMAYRVSDEVIITSK
jgi:hypothetical protein